MGTAVNGGGGRWPGKVSDEFEKGEGKLPTVRSTTKPVKVSSVVGWIEFATVDAVDVEKERSDGMGKTAAAMPALSTECKMESGCILFSSLSLPPLFYFVSRLSHSHTLALCVSLPLFPPFLCASLNFSSSMFPSPLRIKQGPSQPRYRNRCDSVAGMDKR